MIRVHQEPIAIYRGVSVIDADLEWPESRLSLECESSPEARYNAADEWASVFAVREQLKFSRPRMNMYRASSWSSLVYAVVDAGKWPDIELLLSAAVCLQYSSKPQAGPLPLLTHLARKYRNEQDFLAKLPEQRRDEGSASWIANMLAMSPWLDLNALRDLQAVYLKGLATLSIDPSELARGFLGQIMANRFNAGVAIEPFLREYAAECQRHDAAESLEAMVSQMRRCDIGLVALGEGLAQSIWYRLEHQQKIDEQSGY